jgi:transposase-like protein
MNFPKGVFIFYLGNEKEVVLMVVNLRCPECGKGEKSELLEVLSDRKYRMKCGDCGRTFILTASVDGEKKSDKQSNENCCDNQSGKGCDC